MNSLIAKIRKVLLTATFRKSTITFTGTVINALFGAIFYILAARLLGPSGFGIMIVALTVLTLTTDVGNLGTDTGLVNFVSRYIAEQKEKAYKFLKLGLEVKLIVAFVVILIGSLSSKFLAEKLFLKPDLATPLAIAFIGVLSLLLFSFIISALQAMQRFWSWSFIQIITNFLRLLLFVALFYFGFRTVESTMWIYIAVPFLGFLIGLKLIGSNFLKVNHEWNVSSDFFKYNKWVAAFTVVAAISSRMDTFISARLLESTDLGIYSAANQLVKIVPQIVIALGTVIGPRMAGTGGLKEFVSYLKKTQALVLVLAVLGLLSIPFVLFLIPYIFGFNYVATGPVFIVLFIAMLIFLLSVPIHMAVFYYFSYPKLFFMVGSIHLLIVSIGGYYLISNFGVMGAAYIVLIGQVFDFFIPLYYVLRMISGGKK